MIARISGADRADIRTCAAASALLLVGVLLSGCESGSSLLGETAGAQPETQVAQPVAAPASRVSVAPVIGAPDAVAKQLAQDMSSAIGQKKVTVVGAQEKADYALRGYVVAAKDKAGTKVSYIWDVTDPAGRRVNRITGEEIVAGGAGADPWASITPSITQSIAQKSAESLSSWLVQNTSNAALASAAKIASAPPTGVGAVASTQVGSLPSAAAPVTTTKTAAAPATTATVVPALSGAPGDGNSALASALQAELSRNGVASANQGGPAYRVEGVVKVGSANDGKQPVQIDWNVKDPQGKRLGTVTQKNEIAAGSLDGTWGKTADAAAAAAAQGILKLLPKATATN